MRPTSARWFADRSTVEVRINDTSLKLPESSAFLLLDEVAFFVNNDAWYRAHYQPESLCVRRESPDVDRLFDDSAYRASVIQADAAIPPVRVHHNGRQFEVICRSGEMQACIALSKTRLGDLYLALREAFLVSSADSADEA